MIQIKALLNSIHHIKKSELPTYLNNNYENRINIAKTIQEFIYYQFERPFYDNINKKDTIIGLVTDIALFKCKICNNTSNFHNISSNYICLQCD